MRTRLGAYTDVPTTLPSSRLSGMKIHAGRPARAAWAADRVGEVAGGCAAHRVEAERGRGVDRRRDNAILEREARVGDRVVLHPDARHAEQRRQAGHLDQRGEAGVEGVGRAALEREPLVVAPQRRRARGDLLARRQAPGRHRTGARAVRGTLHRSRPVPRRARRRNCGSGAEAHGPAEKRQLRSCRASLSPWRLATKKSARGNEARTSRFLAFV